jgi:heme exporter protein D
MRPAACDQATCDFGDASNSLFPPSPAEAGRWAVDDSDPENQRRGVLLLGNASFGGEAVYVNLYRLYIEENTDPVVKATAIQALARHARAEDAALVAKQLDSKIEQIRVAAAKALQRIHNPAIADLIWKKLINEDEPAAVRVELAIALGQYTSRDVFEALCSALDDRELAVNLAARVTGAEDKKLQLFVWLAIVLAVPVVAAIAHHLVERPARRVLRGLADRRAERHRVRQQATRLA